MSKPTRPLMHYIGFCSICETGPLGLRTCGSCGEVSVMCDECDAVWRDHQTDQPGSSDNTNLACPACHSSLTDGTSHWSTATELGRAEWLAAAVAGGEIQVRMGRAFAPEQNPEG